MIEFPGCFGTKETEFFVTPSRKSSGVTKTQFFASGRRSSLLSFLIRHAFPLLLATITLLGGWLRFRALGVKSLWLDEAFSIWMAGHGPAEMFGWLVRIDQHPPLYYLLLSGWMHLFGDGQGAVRALSAFFSTLTIPVLYASTRRITHDRITALLAALLLAVSPFHVRFAQETRMYALLPLTAALAIYFAIALLQTGEGPRIRLRDWWTPGRWRAHPAMGYAWGLALAQAATMLTHNTAMIFFPLALNLPVLGAWLARRWSGRGSSMPRVNRPHFLADWLQVQAVALLLWSPWAVAFLRQALAVDREFWIPPVDAARITDALAALSFAHLPGWMPDAPWVILGLALAGMGLWRLRTQGAWAALLLSLWLTPFVGELLVSLRRPIFYDRTLIWTTLAWFTLVAVGVCGIGVTERSGARAAPPAPQPWGERLASQPSAASPRLGGRGAEPGRAARWIQALLTLLLVAGSLLGLHTYYATFQKEGWDQAAAYVAEQAEPGDLILFNATWVQIPFDYYYRRYDAAGDLHGVPSDLFDSGRLEPKMTPEDLPRLRELLDGRRRVWLIYSHDWYTDPDGLIPAELGRYLPRSDEREFTGLRILRFGE
jgi:hypothetical protein